MLPSRDILWRRSSTGLTRGCGLKFSGSVTNASPMRSMTSRSTAVGTCAGTCWRFSTDGLGAIGCFSSSLTSLNTCSNWLEKSRSAASASSIEMSPRPISASV